MGHSIISYNDVQISLMPQSTDIYSFNSVQICRSCIVFAVVLEENSIIRSKQMANICQRVPFQYYNESLLQFLKPMEFTIKLFSLLDRSVSLIVGQKHSFFYFLQYKAEKHFISYSYSPVLLLHMPLSKRVSSTIAQYSGCLIK